MTRHLTTGWLGAALAVALTAGAALAAKPFAPPAGWDRVDMAVPAGSQRSIVEWKRDSGDLQQTIMIDNDATQQYDDIVGRIRKNANDNKLTMRTDRDQACAGKTGHVFELVYGPAAKRLAVNRLILPDDAGVVQITYTRPEAAPFAPEIKSDFDAYCGAAP